MIRNEKRKMRKVGRKKGIWKEKRKSVRVVYIVQ